MPCEIAQLRHDRLAPSPGQTAMLGAFPFYASCVSLRQAKDRLYLTGDGLALPLSESITDIASPLCPFDEIGIFGTWDGRHYTPLLAETALGAWTP
ncbi:hypothetical protein [Asaia prunellae]|uniref:hypothetical protein n=1 Tax=Asaia prunellae TaxID=610245 RepID=UPI000AF9FBAD|nr:hypothetical protein [Asaia prunellae]